MRFKTEIPAAQFSCKIFLIDFTLFKPLWSFRLRSMLFSPYEMSWDFLMRLHAFGSLCDFLMILCAFCWIIFWWDLMLFCRCEISLWNVVLFVALFGLALPLNELCLLFLPNPYAASCFVLHTFRTSFPNGIFMCFFVAVVRFPFETSCFLSLMRFYEIFMRFPNEFSCFLTPMRFCKSVRIGKNDLTWRELMLLWLEGLLAGLVGGVVYLIWRMIVFFGLSQYFDHCSSAFFSCASTVNVIIGLLFLRQC